MTILLSFTLNGKRDNLDAETQKDFVSGLTSFKMFADVLYVIKIVGRFAPTDPDRLYNDRPRLCEFATAWDLYPLLF